MAGNEQKPKDTKAEKKQGRQKPNGRVVLKGHKCAIKVGGRETLRGAIFAIVKSKKSIELETLIKAAIKRKPPVSKRPEYVYGNVIKGWIRDGVMETTKVDDETVVVLRQ